MHRAGDTRIKSAHDNLVRHAVVYFTKGRHHQADTQGRASNPPAFVP